MKKNTSFQKTLDHTTNRIYFNLKIKMLKIFLILFFFLFDE